MIILYRHQGKMEAGMGAQDADTLADAIRQVAQAKARGELETVD